MERYYEDEIRGLAERIQRMGEAVEQRVEQAVDALKRQDVELARRTIDSDTDIDRMELENEEYALTLFARFQPQAGDLRFITNALKINMELERIADLAVDICQRVEDLAGQPLLKPLVDIPKLAEVARQMIRGAIESFVNRDSEKARRVILSDTEADRLRNEVQRELLADFLMKDCSSAPRALPLLLVARHLERICDHATNIAEDVIYMVNALVVKHHPERL